MHTTIHPADDQLPGITKAVHIGNGRVCVYLGDTDIYANAAKLRQWLIGTLLALDDMTAEHYAEQSRLASDAQRIAEGLGALGLATRP